MSDNQTKDFDDLEDELNLSTDSEGQDQSKETEKQSDEIILPDSVDDLVSEEEKVIIQKMKDKAKSVFNGNNEKPKPQKQVKADGSSPTEIIVEETRFTKEENDRANMIEQERVLAEHKNNVPVNPETNQFVSPLAKEFENCSILFKGESIYLKIKNGVYLLDKNDFKTAENREEIERCLIQNKFIKV